MSNDLATKLTAYAEGKLDDPEAIIEIEALLTHYIDDRLDEETARQVAAAIEANAALAKLVNEQREGKLWFEEVCFPAMREGESEPSPKVRQYLDDLLADPDAWGKPPEDESSVEEDRAKVVPFEVRRPISQPTWRLMAASIAGLLVIAGSVFLYQIEGRNRLETTLAELTEAQSAQQNQVTALQAELATVTEARRDAETALATAAEEAAGLEAERDELGEQLAVLDRQAREAAEQASQEQLALTGEIGNLQAELANLTEAQRNVDTALAAASKTVEDLLAEVASREQQLAAAESEARQAGLEATQEQLVLTREMDYLRARQALLTETRRDAEGALATASERLEALRTERAEISEQLAARESEADQLAEANAQQQAEFDAQLERLSAELVLVTTAQTTAATQLAAAEGTIAGLEADRNVLTERLTEAESTVASLEGESYELTRQLVASETTARAAEEEVEALIARADWLNQVAGYHRGYAGGMREVEFNEEQVGMLLTWLSQNLGRAVAVPNLTDDGMTFIGGRLFFVDGMPVGQIAYHDQDEKLLAFCLMPNPTGEEKPPTPTRNGDDLNLVDWQDGAYRYVLIGFADSNKLEPIAERLALDYRYDM
jgi:anti-sigma factor RsiW